MRRAIFGFLIAVLSLGAVGSAEAKGGHGGGDFRGGFRKEFRGGDFRKEFRGDFRHDRHDFRGFRHGHDRTFVDLHFGFWPFLAPLYYPSLTVGAPPVYYYYPPESPVYSSPTTPYERYDTDIEKYRKEGCTVTEEKTYDGSGKLIARDIKRNCEDGKSVEDNG